MEVLTSFDNKFARHLSTYQINMLYTLYLSMLYVNKAGKIKVQISVCG